MFDVPAVLHQDMYMPQLRQVPLLNHTEPYVTTGAAAGDFDGDGTGADQAARQSACPCRRRTAEQRSGCGWLWWGIGMGMGVAGGSLVSISREARD